MIGTLRKDKDWYIDFYDSECHNFLSSCALPLYKDEYMYIHQFMIGCKVKFDILYNKEKGILEKQAKILNYIL
jgi:hypothetical protein